jgi:hypothetical protein
VIISANDRMASVITDEPTAVFEHASTSQKMIAVPASTSQGRSVRETVEILRQSGGLMPRALLGGSFVPTNESRLVIEVATSGPSVSGNATCQSQLASPLIPGLPEEFVLSVFNGLTSHPLTGGRLTVDRGAFDAVESSPLAFELAAGLLAVVIAAESLLDKVEPSAREAIEAWS